MSRNKNWVDENSQWLHPDDPIVSLLNRTVLKATVLRGEIYFITCKCYKLDGSYNYFTFVVNEYTIFLSGIPGTNILTSTPRLRARINAFIIS